MASSLCFFGAKPARGKFSFAQLVTASDVYVNVLNISKGSGFINNILIGNGTDTNIQIRITIDGITLLERNYTTFDSYAWICWNSFVDDPVNITTTSYSNAFFVEFNTSLKVEIRRTAGTDNVSSQVLYNLD